MPHSYLRDFVSTMKNQVQGFVSVSLVITEYGNVVAFESASKAVNAEDSAVFQTEIYKQALKSLTEYDENSQTKEVKEILIVSENRIFLIVSTAQGKFLGILVVNSKKSNLGIAKTLLQKNIKSIESKLEEDFS